MDGSQNPSVRRQADGCQGTRLSIWSQPRAPPRGHDAETGQTHTPVGQLAGQTGQTGDSVTSSLLGSCCSLLLRCCETLARNWGLQAGSFLKLQAKLLCCIHAQQIGQEGGPKDGRQKEGNVPQPFP